MNRIRLFLFIYFCLYVGINNRIINSQYSQNHKYCLKSEEPSFWESLNSVLENMNTIMFNAGNILENFYGNDLPYDDRLRANRERENEFQQNNPRAYLRGIAYKLNFNCFLYDKRIDMLDDGTIKETPYNIRPLK